MRICFVVWAKFRPRAMWSIAAFGNQTSLTESSIRCFIIYNEPISFTTVEATEIVGLEFFQLQQIL